MPIKIFAFFAACLFMISSQAAPIQYEYEIITSKPHNPQLFTQGLEINDGRLFESSGLYGLSKILAYPITDEGNVAVNTLPDNIFAEGLSIVGDELFLLSWKAGELGVYDKNSLKKLRSLRYQGEGWGLCHDGDVFYMSDGSDTLTIRNSDDFSVVKTLKVKAGRRASDQLNELECVGDSIWANRYTTGEILEIDKLSGEVRGFIDISPLHYRAAAAKAGAVPNGIAYDKDGGGLWVTGKYWKSLFLLRIKD